MIEILLWAPTRDKFVAALTAIKLPGSEQTLASLDGNGNLVPGQNILIDEIGQITKTPAVLDADRNIVTPAVMIEGHHVNLVALRELADALTAGLAQADANGKPLGLFVRTHILALLGQMNPVPITADGVPAGYEGTSGVRIFDPATINHRVRVWQ